MPAGVAVVTGGSRGIGAACVRELASVGFDCVVGYRAERAAAEALVGECEAAGVRAVARRLEVGDEGSVVAFFEGVDATFGAHSVLVHSAGIVAPKARVDEMSGERLREMMAVNVLGAFYCCRESVRRMSTKRGGAGGSIVLVSSAASRLGSPGEYVDYAASKGAVDTLTAGLAREVATEGIRVNGVRPGLIETEIHASGGQPDRLERLAPGVPMQRAGSAEEVAAAVLWLAGGRASYVTGALLDVGGGR